HNYEQLVPAEMASLAEPKDILILGGGDGMAVREVLKYPSVRSVTLVDLDSTITGLFKNQSLLNRLNEHSLSDPRVSVVTADAFTWLRSCQRRFDFVIADFPDPSNFSLGKLYSDKFYRTLKDVLKPYGAVVIQSTSPYYAKNSFWCVVNTLKSVGLYTMPYHAYVPSFGDWGYVIASPAPLTPGRHYPNGLRYMTADTFSQMLA